MAVEALADAVYVLQEGRVIRTIHGPENLRTEPATHIVFTNLPSAEQQAVADWPGVITIQPIVDPSGITCTGLTVEQQMSDSCLQQLLAAGGSVVSVERLRGLSDIVQWMDPKGQKGSGPE
jgi:hypothetical protein